MFPKYYLLNFFTISFFYSNHAEELGLTTIETVKEEYQIITDVDRNISLPCWPKSFPNKTASVYWEKAGERRKGESVLSDGSLFLSQLKKSDTKLYLCRLVENDLILTKVHLYVRGPPASPSNVRVEASMLDVLVTWNQIVDSSWQKEMGGVPLWLNIKYHLAEVTSPWYQLPNSYSPNENFAHIHNLKPNNTYEIRLISENKYGKSSYVTVFATTKPDFGDVELSYHMLQSSNEINPRVWLMAIVIILLTVNAFGTVVLIIYSRRNRLSIRRNEDPENIELVPNIIENPSYNTESEIRLFPTTRTNPNSSSTHALSSHSEFV